MVRQQILLVQPIVIVHPAEELPEAAHDSPMETVP
jgi:hypothetical protein